MSRLVVLQFFVSLFLIGGCAGFSGKPTSVILQDPATMEFVNCDVDEWGTAASYQRNEECVEAYKKKGYVVWGEH